MSAFDSILRDLRERRLWPVALVLLAALVAVPVTLSKSGQAAPPPPASTPSSATASALPAVSVSTLPSHSSLRGRARDPFAQQLATRAAASTAAGTSPAAPSPATPATTGTTQTNTGASATGGSTATGGTTAGGTSGSGAVSPTPSFPTAPSKPAPPALTATQSYRVTVAITNAAGGLDTIDPLQRLSGLPSDQLPLLVELGVVQGGHRALFLVQPGTVLSGPGQCTPGPIDCEILSLAPNQIETISVQSSRGEGQVAQFTVTTIKAHDDASAAAANKARRSESAVGRRLLAQSTSTALSLFRYEPSLGAVVDLRNLSVGGN